MDATFFDTLPDSIPEREKIILDVVARGEHDQIAWMAVFSKHGDKTGEMFVASDALKIAGVRINATAVLTQLIADATGHLPVPAHVLDLRHEQAGVKASPCPIDVSKPGAMEHMASVEWMLTHSLMVDGEIQKAREAGARPEDMIASTVGKVWLPLCNDLTMLSNLSVFPTGKTGAVNYGWHYPTSGMIQTKGHKHDRWHSDYSQLVVLMLAEMLVDGVKMNVMDVAQDPALAPLVMGLEGVLKIPRQPGVEFGDVAALSRS